MTGTAKTIANMRTAMSQFTGGRLRNETHQDMFETLVKAQEKGPGEFRQNSFELFDDFLLAAIDATNNWIVFAGTDGDATAGATTAGVPEGQITLGSGDGGSTEDGSVLSLILLAKGSLVSLGTTVMEARVAIDVLTGCVVNVGLSDKLATDNEHCLHTVKAGTIADGGLTVTNTAEFVFDSEATAATKWHCVTEDSGTIHNAGVEDALAVGPTANTYQILRIEITSAGVVTFYIDGELKATQSVATTALLIPYISIDGEDGTPVNTDLAVDYIYFQGARPSSDA